MASKRERERKRERRIKGGKNTYNTYKKTEMKLHGLSDSIVLRIENSNSTNIFIDGERKDRSGEQEGSETEEDGKESERYRYKYINIKENMRKV